MTLRTWPAPLVLTAVTVSLAATAVRARALQVHDHPSAEEFAERAQAAEAAPLFASDDPLALTLRTDIKWLRDKRPDEEEVEGTVTVVQADGSELVLPVKVRTRGNFRRQKRNCNFPPLRLNFAKGEVEGSVFEGQDKLKLVTPCHDSRGSYQDYVYLEYLAYRAYQIVTPISFRVRLIEVTYEDVQGDYDTRTKIGFLIEDDERMAARNNAVLEEVGELNPGQTSAEYSVMMSLFQYMIGNTDWSAIQFHNVKLLHTQSGQYYTVPYDFDFSGTVNARYAAPDPNLSIKNVRQRVFRGFCFPQVREREQWEGLFLEKRQAITDLYMGFPLLDEGDRKRAVEYFDDFWSVMASDRQYEREIAGACRG